MEYGQKKIEELFLHKHYKLFVSVLSIINYAYNISNNMHYYLLNLDIYSSLTTFYQVKMVHFMAVIRVVRFNLFNITLFIIY